MSPTALGKTTVAFSLLNNGTRAGVEISQCYLRFPDAADEPPLQLKGFTKTHLEAGESKSVVMTLSLKDFSVWSDIANGWVPQSGDYLVYIGSSSVDLRLTKPISISFD